MRVLILLTLLLRFVLPVAAQDGYPLPESLPVITPENAADLQPLAAIGAALPGNLAWSPDGKTLAVSTSAASMLYDAANPDAPPMSIPASQAVQFNAAGEFVAGGQRWDIQTGELLGAVEPPPLQQIVSPSGEIVASWSTKEGSTIIDITHSDGRVQLLDLGRSYDIAQIVFSPDEKRAAFALEYVPEAETFRVVAVQLWNIEDGEFIADLPQALEVLDTLAFHANGDLLVTATSTNAVYAAIFGDVRIWDSATGQQLGNTDYGYGLPPVRFSPDERFFAFQTAVGVDLWSDHEIATFQFTPDYRAGQQPDFQFRPDGLTLAATSNDGILLWNIGGEFDLNSDQLLPTEAGVYDLRYTPDGEFLIALEADGNIEIWDADSGERHRHIPAGTNLYRLDLSPDERWLRGLASASHEAIFWDINTGQEQVRLPRGAVLNSDWSYAAYWDAGTVHITHMPTAQDTALSIIPDYLGAISGFDAEAEQVVFSGQQSQAFDLRSGLPTADPAPILANGGALLSPDGRLKVSLVGSCGALNVSIHDAQTDELLVGLSIYDVCGLFTGVFSHDGQWLILGFDSVLSFMDVQHAIELAASDSDRYIEGSEGGNDFGFYFQPSGEHIRRITLSPDSSLLAAAFETNPLFAETRGITNRVDVFDYADLFVAGEAETQPEPVVSIPDAKNAYFSPDSRWLMTNSGLWNTTGGEQIAEISSVAAAFSPANDIVATVDTDGVRLWSIGDLTAGEITPLVSLSVAAVQEAGFSPDGTLMYLKRAGDVAVWGIQR